MSTQKLKKGFTLIELMVVIVIIGILAAIAIPKLFGMSAKAKAQEVGPAVGTWVKMQQAYKMETGNWGGNKEISYKMPGDQPDSQTSTTSNFSYSASVAPTVTSTATVDLKAKNKFTADGCADQAGEWGGSFGSASADIPTIIVPTNDCSKLTPNFGSIGR